MKKRLQYRKGIYLLPSLFTTGNVFCGFYAFIAVFNDDFGIAGWAIVFAIIFDVLDGRVARLTNTTSEFGEQYDSLADIISFGMAPAFLAYAWVLKPYGRLGWMASRLRATCRRVRPPICAMRSRSRSSRSARMFKTVASASASILTRTLSPRISSRYAHN